MTAETNTVATSEAKIFFTKFTVRALRLTLDETFVSETPFLPGVSREYVKPMETHPVGGSRRALILDDDPMVGVLLDNLVGSFGFTTGRARTVSEARKMLKSLDPDVVLVGWILLAYWEEATLMSESFFSRDFLKPIVEFIP